MSQDFLGSTAQEDVSFITQIVRTSIPGDNFYKLLVFIEGTPDVSGLTLDSGRFLTAAGVEAFVPLRTGSDIFMAEVTRDTYAEITNGLLKAWLDDFFYSNHNQSAYLAVYGVPLGETPLPADIDAAEAGLLAAYTELKAHAYHKTICAGAATSVLPDLAVALAMHCAADRDLLSAAPYYPMTVADAADFADDLIYAALKLVDPTFLTTDAFMTIHATATRNGSLFSLGLAFSLLNSTGTPIGNSMDFWATDGISASGPDGSNLSKTIRDLLKAANIAFFKPVGDQTGQVNAVGVKTLGGRMIQAHWIVNYINFMCKVLVARFITKPNTIRDATSYAGIINIMTAQINRFGIDGSGRLRNVIISAPSFISLPPAAGDEIIVPKAWSAEYNDQVHSVQVYGTLIISE